MKRPIEAHFAEISCCGNGILINAELDSTAEYQWYLRDCKDVVHHGTATPGIYAYGTGLFIPATELPPGLLDTGSFMISLTKDGAPVPLKIAQYFNNVYVEIVNGGDDFEVGEPY